MHKVRDKVLHVDKLLTHLFTGDECNKHGHIVTLFYPLNIFSLFSNALKVTSSSYYNH